jgi:hypothetical protein
MHQKDIRETLFSDCKEINRWLDRWWTAAKLYIDQDSSDSLSLPEYSVLHHRLCNLVAPTNSATTTTTTQEALLSQLKSNSNEVEIFLDRQLKEDFQADSGGDENVNCEEFRYAVFQLADQWIDSCDVDEYVKFLKHGYEVVFSDLIEQDKVRVPKEWKKYVRTAKSGAPIGINKAIDTITSIIHDKIKADKV